jgi:KDO2-lipid IV(A) lauroyltransferase
LGSSAARRWTRPLRRRLMVVAARLLMRLSPLIPMRFARGVGSLLGWVARVVAPRYRRMAAGHIAKAFPDLSDAERAHLLREVYRSAAQGAIEAAKANELSNERLKELVIVPDEERPRLEVAQKRGAGAIWVTPHMGPWELFPRYVIRCLGFRVVIIAKEQQGLEDLIGEMRRRAGVEILLKGDGGLRPLARALGEGAVVGGAARSVAARRERPGGVLRTLRAGA